MKWNICVSVYTQIYNIYIYFPNFAISGAKFVSQFPTSTENSIYTISILSTTDQFFVRIFKICKEFHYSFNYYFVIAPGGSCSSFYFLKKGSLYIITITYLVEVLQAAMFHGLGHWCLCGSSNSSFMTSPNSLCP